MSTINEKLGLKPRTRTRAATHSSGLLSAEQCPKCACRHVIEHVLKAPGEHVRKPWAMCASCSCVWERRV